MGHPIPMALWAAESVDPGLAPDETAGTLYFWGAADEIPGLSDSDPVATWPDLSAAGRDYAQGTAGSRPLWKTNVQNGLPGILFDGADDYLENLDDPSVNAVQVIMVASLSASPDSEGHIAFSLDQIVSSHINLTLRRSDANGNWLAFGSINSSHVLPTDGSAHVVTWMKNSAASGHVDTRQRIYIRADGTYYLDQTNTAVTETLIASIIGATFGGGFSHKGHIFETAVWSGSSAMLSNAETAAVEQYLSVKYGIPLA